MATENLRQYFTHTIQAISKGGAPLTRADGSKHLWDVLPKVKLKNPNKSNYAAQAYTIEQPNSNGQGDLLEIGWYDSNPQRRGDSPTFDITLKSYRRTGKFVDFILPKSGTPQDASVQRRADDIAETGRELLNEHMMGRDREVLAHLMDHTIYGGSLVSITGAGALDTYPTVNLRERISALLRNSQMRHLQRQGQVKLVGFFHSEQLRLMGYFLELFDSGAVSTIISGGARLSGRYAELPEVIARMKREFGLDDIVITDMVVNTASRSAVADFSDIAMTKAAIIPLSPLDMVDMTGDDPLRKHAYGPVSLVVEGEEPTLEEVESKEARRMAIYTESFFSVDVLNRAVDSGNNRILSIADSGIVFNGFFT